LSQLLGIFFVVCRSSTSTSTSTSTSRTRLSKRGIAEGVASVSNIPKQAATRVARAAAKMTLLTVSAPRGSPMPLSTRTTSPLEVSSPHTSLDTLKASCASLQQTCNIRKSLEQYYTSDTHLYGLQHASLLPTTPTRLSSDQVSHFSEQ
jgi:hypothetical protein